MLLGVGHVFDLSEGVKNAIIGVRPDVVALELDAARFQALLSRDRSGRASDVPFVYRLLSLLQKNLAEQYGGEVGGEMMAAARAAHETGAKIALIDMDAVRAFSRIRKSMSMRETISMLFSIFISFFVRKSTVEKELEEYRKDEERYLGEMKKAYPSMVNVLISERNEYMVEQLRLISSTSDAIVAVVGDGHVSGMSTMLSQFADVEIKRFDELKTTQSAEGNLQVTYSYHIDNETEQP